MKCVILAAGEGTRLRPLTETRPKPMLYVAGKPLIFHLLTEAKKAGINEAIIVVRYKKEKLIEYLSKTDFGMKIKFIEQGPENGTGAALLCAQKEMNDTFVVLAGDIVTEASVIKKIMEAHKGGITVGLKKVTNSHLYGVAELSGDKISLFEEKPRNPKSNLANISVYCMEPTVFSELKSIGKSEREEHELVSLFIGARGVVVDGYWQDIAFPWDLLDANEFLLSKMEIKSGHIENSTIDGRVIMEEGAKIINSYIEGCVYVGANSIIGPNAYLKGFNSIGQNCSIGGGTTLKNSILLDNVNAKHLAYIGDSVIGENVNFGSGTQIANYRFDGGHINVVTERGWTNSGKKKLGIFVGDNTKFGVLSCTMPGKLIGSNCWIGSGVVVKENLESNNHIFVKQEVVITKEKKE